MLVKLTMIENETTREGEDDTVQVTATTAVVYVDNAPGIVRSLHARKPQEGLPRPDGTRIAFANGSQFSVTESPERVAELFGYVPPVSEQN